MSATYLRFNYEIEDSFDLAVYWTTRALDPPAPLPTNDPVLDSRLYAQWKKTLEMHKKKPPIIGAFSPSDQALAERIVDDEKYFLLFREIAIDGLDDYCPIETEEDFEERKKLLLEANSIHYLRIKNLGEFIVVGDPGVKFLPGKSTPRSFRANTKRGRAPKMRTSSRRKLKSSQREKLAIVIRAFWIDHRTDEHIYHQDAHPFAAPVYEPRFRQRITLDYETVSKLKEGDILNPVRPLTKAFDPELNFLKRDDDGNNVLTNFEGISIPLFWPNWSDSRLEDLKDLASWTERSYESYIYFLEGKLVDSLDEFISPDSKSIERIAHPSTRNCAPKAGQGCAGQCYCGDYERISICGHYFIFEVHRAGKIVFILDSLHYGVALRVFWRKEDALDYISGGEKRRAAKELTVWPWQVHDPEGNWKNKLERRLSSLAEN